MEKKHSTTNIWNHDISLNMKVDFSKCIKVFPILTQVKLLNNILHIYLVSLFIYF